MGWLGSNREDDAMDCFLAGQHFTIAWHRIAVPPAAECGFETILANPNEQAP